MDDPLLQSYQMYGRKFWVNADGEKPPGSCCVTAVVVDVVVVVVVVVDAVVVIDIAPFFPGHDLSTNNKF